MPFSELIFFLLSHRKSLLKFVLGSSITYGAYVGAIRPSIGSTVTKLDGTDRLQGKFRSSIKLDQARSSNIDNALELTSLKNLEENRHRFHPSLSKYLVKKNIVEKQGWDWDFVNSGVIGESTDSWAYCNECSTLSDRQIIYGESYFSKKIATLQDSELVQDILWSLWEESKYSGTLIHSESIIIDLQVDRDKTTPEVKQFSLSFKVSNLSGKKAKIFRTIEIEPNTETKVNILLENGDLRPMPVTAGVRGVKYAGWNLFPKNTQWKVIKNIQKPIRQITKESHSSLQLLYGSSRFIPFKISMNDQRKIAINNIDYAYIKDKLTPYLNSITVEKVQKDIESWYGGYVAYLLRTRIGDIQNIIELMQKKTIENGRGIKESIFERTLNDYQFRNNLYHHFKFDENFKKVFNQLLTNNEEANNKKIRITIHEITGALKSWVAQLKDIQDSIRVEIDWIKRPEKVYSGFDRNGEFPHFAFSFKQKITWTKEMKIPLKGTWNIKDNRYVENVEQQSTDDKYVFNITNKLVSLRDILSPLTSTIASLGSGGKFGGIDIMNSLIPDVGRFIGIDALKIGVGESISYTYQTDSSPITLAIDDTSDLQGNHFPRMNIGWKAIDVNSSLDLSQFTKFFYSIYEKFDLGKPEKGTLNIGQLISVKKDLEKEPISFIAHAINSIFDKTYVEKIRGDESKRPWPVFFRALFENSLTFQHSQMMVGYSNLFFKYEEWWGVENKIKKSGNCKETTTTTEYWCTDFDFSKKGAIVKAIDEEVDLISSSLIFNHSMYLPDAPIVLQGFGNKGEQYDKFLSSLGAGVNSNGILNSKNQIIEIVKDSYKKNSRFFEGEKVVNWDKTTVSFAQLNLKKAIESVLALEHTWRGFTSGAGLLLITGIKFHEILGEALLRDGFWINVNLMHEYGLFTKQDFNFTKRMVYYPNSEIWLKVNPSLDHKKLKLGNVSGWLS